MLGMMQPVQIGDLETEKLKVDDNNGKETPPISVRTIRKGKKLKEVSDMLYQIQEEFISENRTVK